MKGETVLHREAVFAEGGYDPRERQCFEDPVRTPDDVFAGIYYDKTNIPAEKPDTVCRTVMVRTGDWKLVVRSAPGQIDELYDMRRDPGELANLINRPECSGVVRELRDKLLYWFLRTSDNPRWEHRRQV